MQRLAASLVILVTATVIGLGWLFDFLYIKVSPNAEGQDDVTFYRHLISDASEGLVNEHQLEHFMAHWKDNKHFIFEINELDVFPVPSEVKSDFLSGEPLILETESGVTVHAYLPELNKVLSLNHDALRYSGGQGQTSFLPLLFTLFFYIAITALILIWLYPLITRLLLLRKAAKDFGDGDLDRRIQVGRMSYISDIEREFNRMASRIQELIGDNKLLSRAVSHELKTPIARLRFGLDMLADAESIEQQRRHFEGLQEDLDEMQSLVEELLGFARLDSARVNVEYEYVSLDPMLQELLKPYKKSALEVSYSCQYDDAVVRGDKFYLNMLVNNIVKNAVKYAEHRVLVSLFLQNGKPVISVEDDGPGIPINEREDVMQPFYRGIKSKKAGSHGMGLAIVKRIAEWHELKVVIAESQLGGAKLLVEF